MRKPLSLGQFARPPTNVADSSLTLTIHVKRPGVSGPSTPRTHSRPPTPRCSLNALASANSHAEILAQRARIGELLGRIRDLEAEWTQDAVERITTENATLKQRVRQLSTDNRTLDERLTAARSNLRFRDRRIADLEARLTKPANPT